jgi:hypothetical protein
MVLIYSLTVQHSDFLALVYSEELYTITTLITILLYTVLTRCDITTIRLLGSSVHARNFAEHIWLISCFMNMISSTIQ